MARVQQPQLHQLAAGTTSVTICTPTSSHGGRAGEVLLQRPPLAERPTDNRPGILDAEAFADLGSVRASVVTGVIRSTVWS